MGLTSPDCLVGPIIIIFIPHMEPKYHTVRLNTGHLQTLGLIIDFHIRQYIFLSLSYLLYKLCS